MTDNHAEQDHDHAEKNHGHGHQPFFGGKILTGILIGVFVFLLVIVFVVPTISIQTSGEEVRIAVLLPLSGDFAEDFGYIYQQGVEMAYDELRADGKNIVIDYYDTQSDTSVALDQFFAAVMDGHTVVFGPCVTSDAEAIAPYAEMYKIVMMTEVTGPSLSDYDKYVFRFVPSNYNFCYANIGFLKTLNASEMTVIWTPNTLGRSTFETFSEIAKEEGIEVHSIPLTTFDDVVAELNATNPDWVYLIPDTADELSGLMTAIVDSGITMPTMIIASDDGFGPAVRDNNATLGVDVLVPTLSTADPLFLTNYKDRFGVDFDVSRGYALYGYDGIKTLADAVSWSQATGVSVADTLRSYRALGQTGAISFDENLDRHSSYETYTPAGNRWYQVNLAQSGLVYDQDKLRSYAAIRDEIQDAYRDGDSEKADELVRTTWTHL